MQCFIYKSLKKTELYLYLTKKDDFSDLPESCIDAVKPLEFVMSLELTPERKLAREDSNKVLKNLQDKGYFIQLPPVIFNAPSSLQ